MRKKATGLIWIVVCAALCLTGCGSKAAKVPVMSVSEILGIGPVGMVDRFSGVVEAGETVSVNKESDMDIAEISVSEGDAVSKGQVLFSYETAALSIEVERLQLEVEQLNNTITTKKSQIASLEKEQKAADSADKLQYTLQIQQLQLDIKETEFSVSSKQKDVDRAKTKLADANVLSPTSGHIKAVNSGSDAVDPNTGEPLPLIVIAEEGEFRVKGTINEQNAASISEGTNVVIRSRMDSELLWTGTVTSIDWENPVQGGNDFYYMPTDEMTSSSKYPFYVKLNSDIGLMIGQHVYIEQDVGQTEAGDEESGFYLPSYYLNDLDGEAWVWAANAKDKLEKRTIVLGNYNIELDSYEILGGLELTDFIAYPDENCKVGAPVSYPGEEAEDLGGEDYIEGEEGSIEGEEGFIGGEDGFIEGEEGFIGGENGLMEGENGFIEGEDGLMEGEDGFAAGEDNSLKGLDGFDMNEAGDAGELTAVPDADFTDPGQSPEPQEEEPDKEDKKGGLSGFFDRLFGRSKDKTEQEEDPAADETETITIPEGGMPGDVIVEDPSVAVVPGTEAVG